MQLESIIVQCDRRSVGIHPYTVARVRKRYVNKGEAPALNRQVRQSPPTPKKIDGAKEAHLIAICCSTAPEGRDRWTLTLLVNELTRRGVVSHISRETVRQTLKKINLSVLHQPGLKRRMGDAQTLEKELAAWQKQRNQQYSKIDWRFTTEDARIKLAHLYPYPAF